MTNIDPYDVGPFGEPDFDYIDFLEQVHDFDEYSFFYEDLDYEEVLKLCGIVEYDLHPFYEDTSLYQRTILSDQEFLTTDNVWRIRTAKEKHVGRSERQKATEILQSLREENPATQSTDEWLHSFEVGTRCYEILQAPLGKLKPRL